MRHMVSVLTLISACALVVGCDDDDEDRDAGIDAGRVVPDAGPPPGDDLAEVVSEDDRFDTLEAALTRAGLVDDLSTASAATVFAPTDDAFAASGITLEDIDAMPIDQLRQILLYHVILGSTVRAADLRAQPYLTGATLTLFVDVDGVVRLNRGNTLEGGADVIAADVDASNGVIHAIDRVLLPPDVVDLAAYGGLTQLGDALVSTGLNDDLETATDVTVFAPTNEAFVAIGTLPDRATLTNVLLYHVVGRSLTADEIEALSAPTADTLAVNAFGNPLTVVFGRIESGLEVNDAAVLIADLRATNGVVHVIEEVLVPPNIVEMVELADLTGLQAALAAAAPVDGTPLTDLLATAGPFTVFAPTNEAFDEAADTIAGLTPEQLRDVLLFHVLDPTTFDDPVLVPMLPATPTPLATLNSQAAMLTSVSPPVIEGATVVIPDINVTNGVIHVIDAVMIPDDI